jgi:putative hydrolase of the HAD superfamily
MSGRAGNQTAVLSQRGPDLSPGARALTSILFDFGGTLDADGTAWKERFEALYRGEGVELTAPALSRVFYDADDPLVGALGEGVDLPRTVALLVANMEAGLAAAGQDAEPVRGMRVAARFLDETAATVARNRAVLQALRQRYRLGIVSNFYGNLDSVCRGLGLAELFEVMVDSEQVGARKPEPAIFQAAMGPMGAEARATVMVGDSLHRDREGALRSNLGFIWIASPEAQGSAGPDAAAHPIIASLDQITGLLL